jgi:dTDP-4-amino-4,6-dideoxygalactose transaminase
MLSFAAMDFPEQGEVIAPSFTFAATIGAIVWNRLTPVFVDCVKGTMTIDPVEVVKAIGPRTAAICPVTIYGLPPDLADLAEISKEYGIPLILDSAQGLGSTYRGRPVGGYGLCEVFSLSPTKVVTAIEGGVITLNEPKLADRLRSMRDYGRGPDREEVIYNGLSARMSEIHASVGLLSLRNLESLRQARLNLISRYRERCASLHGCTVQLYPDDRTTSGNYFVLLVGEDARISRDQALEALEARGVQCKRYFFPPVHTQSAFSRRPHRIVGDLHNTWSASKAALALPLYSHMTHEQLGRVCDALDSALG